VDRLTLRQVAARTRELTAQARAGRLSAADLRGATFTVTNLGMYGIDAFTPILHLPQTAILGVGRIVREPAVVEDRIVPRDMVTLSLTFDHRAVDGAPAARFLDALRRCVEQPAPWLLP
jgi:pyruvate dehydrogenase E2 component (dihydrolipoamide acetyltransferase)